MDIVFIINYTWKKLEIFLLLSPKILLILSWKYIGYKLKQKNILASYTKISPKLHMFCFHRLNKWRIKAS